MESGEVPEQGVHFLDLYGVLHRAAPFSPKKSLDAVVSEVTPSKSKSKSAAGLLSPGARRSPRDAVPPKTSPFLNRSLRRALLTSPARLERNAAEGAAVLNAADSEALNAVDDGGPQSKSSRGTRASTLDYMAQIFPGRRQGFLL